VKSEYGKGFISNLNKVSSFSFLTLCAVRMNQSFLHHLPIMTVEHLHPLFPGIIDFLRQEVDSGIEVE
jgi:hypothetical protein